jgi:hypothetical protein
MSKPKGTANGGAVLRTPNKSGRFRSRIVGTGDEAPDQLLANPKNWRIHPKHQQDALAGVLTEVGWVQQVVVNRRTGFVVDGHLRVTLALREDEPTIPVVYVDLSEAEEGLVLATIDPLSALAGRDDDKLRELLGDAETNDPALRALLDSLEVRAEDAPMPDLPDGDREPFQQMTFTLHDEQVESVRRAMSAADALGPYVGSPNENGNGNALARVCETFLTANA